MKRAARGSAVKKPGIRVRFRIRRGTSRDIARLVRHRVALSRELGGGKGLELRSFARRYRRWLREVTGQGRLVPFVAVGEDGSDLGSGCLWLREDRPRLRAARGAQARITAMYVPPTGRGSGIGSRLLESMIRWARAHGYLSVHLRTSPQATRWYRSYGFVPVPELRLAFGTSRERGRARTARARTDWARSGHRRGAR